MTYILYVGTHKFKDVYTILGNLQQVVKLKMVGATNDRLVAWVLKERL